MDVYNAVENMEYSEDEVIYKLLYGCRYISFCLLFRHRFIPFQDMDDVDAPGTSTGRRAHQVTLDLF